MVKEGLTDFLRKCKSTKKNGITHTRIGDKDLKIFGGSYDIKDTDLNEFYMLYYNKVFVNKNEEYITEKQIQTGQMLVDLDFRYSYEIDTRQHTAENIETIIYNYLETFKEFYDFDDRQFKVYIFEKPNINRLSDMTLTKDGIHLLFGFNVPFEIQMLIRDKMIKKFEKEEILDLPLINSWNSVFDEGISKGTTNWTLIGSRKPDNEAYELKMVKNVTFDKVDNEPMIEDDYDFEINKDTIKMLSCRFTDIPKYKLKSNIKIKSEDAVKSQKKANDRLLENMEIIENIKETKSLKLLINYAELLDIKYIDNYSSWIRIIWGLKSFAKNENEEQDLYKLALSITMKSKHYQSEDYFRNKWNSYTENKGVSIGSFYFYCKCSNEEKYLNLKSSENENLILNVINDTSDYNIANCFNAIYGDDFIYCGKDNLYYWNGIYWEQDNTALKRCIMKSYRNIFIDYSRELLNEMKTIDKMENPDLFSNVEARIKKVNSVKDILSSIYKVKQISETCELFISEHSKDINFETNANILCFKDKVFDLEQNKFVNPYKYDYMNLNTGYNYREPTEQEKKDVNSMLEQIFPLQDERTLYLVLLSIGLSGYFLEKFIIANGSGGNGKGMLNDFFMSLIGNYGYTAPNAILTNPIKDGANQAIANMNNKRFVLAREPKETAKLDESSIKEFTGGCEINARGLYSGNTKVILRLLMVLEANKVPKIGGETDNALMRRIIDILFRAKFVSNKEDVDEENYVFLADVTKKENSWKEKHRYALFHILTEYFQKWIKSDKNIDTFIPKSVKDRTQEYLKNSSEIYSWISDNYELVDSSEYSVVTIKEIHTRFTQSEIYMNYTKKEKRACNLKEFTEQITRNVFLTKHYKARCVNKEYCGAYNKKNGCEQNEIRNVLLNYRQKDNDTDDSKSENELNDNNEY